MSLLDAKIHSLRGANHGDGQQEVVADLHRSPGTHTPTVGDLKYAHNGSLCLVSKRFHLGSHVLQQDFSSSKGVI